MSDLTTSEQLFQTFCDAHNIEWQRVPRATTQTPDYEIGIHGQRIIVEIKQIDPSKDEKREMRELIKTGRTISGNGAPGDRMRRIIDVANRQLRNRSQGRFPSLAVVYNNVPHTLHADPYCVLVAMYGLEQLNLRVPQDPTFPIRIVGESFGGERMMTPSSCTSTSAVAVFRSNDVVDCTLDVYHNIYAAVPLNPEVLTGLPVRQYTLPHPGEREFQRWEDI